ncbi:hypothetical protein CcCBS67573_g10544 [Chytriomyces confervae]|uniref:DDE Tnp4 domain-containing protein n=1 Tax=Chytriomyces confervae TaxID=246404 RepID=A0A507CS79_9FUNG|nr:hypothetical protein CcCBS67573_g10544 [Chytriomyces confervae]
MGLFEGLTSPRYDSQFEMQTAHDKLAKPFQIEATLFRHRYQVAVALGTSQIVYMGGGVPCGKWPDLKMAHETLLRLIEPGERDAADQGYRGDPRLITKLADTSAAAIAQNHNLKQMGACHERRS